MKDLTLICGYVGVALVSCGEERGERFSRQIPKGRDHGAEPDFVGDIICIASCLGMTLGLPGLAGEALCLNTFNVDI